MIKLMISSVCLLIMLYNYHKKRLLSSSSMWVLAYFMIMVIYPVYSYHMDFNNAGLIDMLALGGSLCFLFGFIVGNRYKLKTKKKGRNGMTGIAPDYQVSKIAFWITFAFSIAALLYLLGVEGVRSILHGMTTAKQFALNKEKSNSLYVFAVHMMVPCILAIWMSAKKKKEKYFRVFALGIYIVETILFGFTRLFLIVIIVIIFIYEMRGIPQRRQLIYSMIGIAGTIVALVATNFIRTFGLGRISGMRDYIKLDYVFESTDFGASYYWFNELLNYESPYINPVVYLKPIFMVIPRALWETKPEPLSMQVLKYVNPLRAATGYSTAGNSVLGEGYSVLGYPGIFLFPFLWGILCSRLDKNYFTRLKQGIPPSYADIIYYIFAVFIVISGQRGDWCQYMGIVCWFYVFPLYLLSKVVLKVRTVKSGSDPSGKTGEDT